jgi:putative nucleotidyltransferase with HDIG domain
MNEHGSQILVVDDEPGPRDVLYKILTRAGYVCRTAANAADALEVLRKNSIALVLSDIMMPGSTGIDLLRQAKRLEPEVAVVMVTAVSDRESAVTAMRLGADDYIVKPFNLDEVLIGVRRALEKRRLILENKAYQRDLENKVIQRTRELEQTHQATLAALVAALDLRDGGTGDHSQRVTRYALAIGQELGLDVAQLNALRQGALLHDIGKIGLPDAILSKPGPLTPDERALMLQHTRLGYQMLQAVPFLKDALDIICYHHERYDGTGYPDGLVGEEIPLGARIFAVADAYDAMTSYRPYRTPISHEDALLELQRCVGSQFDPGIVEVFLRIVQHAPLDRRVNQRGNGADQTFTV